MKVSPYAGNISRNQYEDKARATTERVRNTDRGSEMIEAAEPPSKNCLNKKWILILIISILILAGIIAGLVVGLKKTNVLQSEDSSNYTNIFSSEKEYEEAKVVFSPSFKIKSNEKTLTQLSQKSFQTYESTSSGQESSYNILNKAIYDIYTINSTSSLDSENIFYTKKYTTVITVNSLCSKVSSKSFNVNSSDNSKFVYSGIPIICAN